MPVKHSSQFRGELAHSLVRTSRSRDDVLGIQLAIMLQLPKGAIAILWLSVRVMSPFHDAKVVMNNLGQRCKAVGGGRGTADNLEGIVIPLVVYA